MRNSKINTALQKLDSEYFELRRKFNLIPDITPLNIKAERDKFFTKKSKKQKYNPQFKYKKSKNLKYIKDVSSIKRKLKKIDHPLVPLYIEKLDSTLDWISNFENRENPDFVSWLCQIYQRPSKKLFLKSSDFKILKRDLKTNEKKNIYPKEAKDLIKDSLANFGFDSWDVNVTYMTAKMSVNSILGKVKINKDKRFSQEAVERLCIHEIGTHVYRNENGRKQPYQILKFGLPEYLDTEEGLAIWSEYINGVRVKFDDIKYRVRVMASYMCFEMDFCDLYDYVFQFLDKDTSFDVVTRIKRGMTDTSNLGGYTKDQVYYKGFLRVEKLKKKDLKKLYIGKVGIDHIPLLEEVEELNWDVPVPKWVEKMK